VKAGAEGVTFVVERPTEAVHGDYATMPRSRQPNRSGVIRARSQTRSRATSPTSSVTR